MTMTKTDLKNAFREVVSSEFEHIPTDESSIDFAFSEHFNARMAKLVNSQRKSYYKYVNTALKRVAIICVVILALLTTACSVKSIREPIRDLFIEIHETFARFFYIGESTEVITREHFITDLPDGFVQTDKVKDDFSICTTFENSSGDSIEFYQTVTDKTEYSIDTEQGNTTEYKLGSDTVYIHEANDTVFAIWYHDRYWLTLTVYGSLDMGTVKEMIRSVK